MFHNRTKHIDIRYHFIRQIIEEGLIEVKYIWTEDMVSDMMTKGLGGPKHSKFVKGLGMLEYETWIKR